MERGGELAGCGTLGRAGRGRLQAVGCTHPDHAGQGVGALLVELGERRAGAAILRNSVLASDAGAIRMLEARAYVAGTRHLRMRVDLEERPPTVAAPAGIRLSGFRPGADDAEVDACVEEAFDHRWTHQAEWRAAKAADPRFDPELWIVARDGPDVCGVVLCTPGTFGMGFVESLAVRASWRRRGVGAALLAEALRRLWDAGERCVGLGVDADNPAAIRLYARGRHAHGVGGGAVRTRPARVT